MRQARSLKIEASASEPDSQANMIRSNVPKLKKEIGASAGADISLPPARHADFEQGELENIPCPKSGPIELSEPLSRTSGSHSYSIGNFVENQIVPSKHTKR